MRSNFWQLQEAKNNLSELVNRSVKEGPQSITIHGKTAVVVVSQTQFDELSKPKESLTDFFARIRKKGAVVDISRDKGSDRDIDF